MAFSAPSRTTTASASRPASIASTIAFALDAGEFAVDAANIDKARIVPDWVALGLAPAVDDSGRDARPGKQKKPAGKKPAAKTPTNKPAARKPSGVE